MTKKIVLVGAGSAMFTQGLLADLIMSPDLGPWELGLVDIDPQALETAEGLSRRMVESKEAEIAIRASMGFAVREPLSCVLWIETGIGFRVRSIGFLVFAQIRSPESWLDCAREDSLFSLENQRTAHDWRSNAVHRAS